VVQAQPAAFVELRRRPKRNSREKEGAGTEAREKRKVVKKQKIDPTPKSIFEGEVDERVGGSWSCGEPAERPTQRARVAGSWIGGSGINWEVS